MRALTAILIAFVVAVPANGQSFTVTFGSKHYATSESKNEANPGAIVGTGVTEKIWGKAGIYENSEGKASVFLGGGYRLVFHEYFRAYVGMAAATGYGTLIHAPTLNTVGFFPTVSLEIGPKNYSLSLINMPGVV